MRFVVLALLISSSPAFAEVEQNCRHIQAKAEREACYQRQEVARVARQKAQEAHEAEQQKPLQSMAPEDAQLAKSLRSICRGC